ncbi:DUF1385 domain-containing protein [Clostridiaceae bacterium M8S5]|nr:DUF1385 domain-containing protein [Clostridiaceae bacterium M8S5]
MKKTVYGGQALIEGLMIKGTNKTSIAIRKTNDEIEVKNVTFENNIITKKIPIVRGMVEYFRMNVQGIKAIMYSAEIAGLDNIPSSKLEEFLIRKFGNKFNGILLYFAAMISVFFSIALFVLIPNLIIGFIGGSNTIVNNALEGMLRLVIFTVYIIASSNLKDMKRIWMYHGAEHKTIHCYENNESLTIQNVRKYSTKHSRCGTSYIVMVLVISIVIFSFVGWYSPVINMIVRLSLMPLIAGISYEIFKGLYICDNKQSRF